MTRQCQCFSAPPWPPLASCVKWSKIVRTQSQDTQEAGGVKNKNQVFNNKSCKPRSERIQNFKKTQSPNTKAKQSSNHEKQSTKQEQHKELKPEINHGRRDTEAREQAQGNKTNQLARTAGSTQTI